MFTIKRSFQIAHSEESRTVKAILASQEHLFDFLNYPVLALAMLHHREWNLLPFRGLQPDFLEKCARLFTRDLAWFRTCSTHCAIGVSKEFYIIFKDDTRMWFWHDYLHLLVSCSAIKSANEMIELCEREYDKDIVACLEGENIIKRKDNGVDYDLK